jgi:manganese transport protein
MSSREQTKSLNEVHESIDPYLANSKWRKLFAFFGPAYLVSVGYMDPGNWATDIAGGSQFGYRLIWVLLMSNLMALLLQGLSARLGLVRGRDLAQCSRAAYTPGINIILYVLAEIAIAACDLAEVLGMAIGLNLLFHIPILYGVLITLLDTLLLLYLQRLGMRKLEAFIIGLISIIGVCFLLETFFAKPDMHQVLKGFIPTLPDHNALYIAIGIIGATVMPHNLYLHSALVQTRKVNRDETSLRKALRINLLDSGIALNIAFFINAAILILAGAVFYTSGHHQVATLQDAHQLLAPLLGTTWAPKLFAIALVASGQSSTITGTLAGQIVMEGHLRLRINPLIRRLMTRLLAIVPTVLVILLLGDGMVGEMLVFSQVLLSMQLAFAVIPLIHFVSDAKTMGAFTINKLTKFFAWLVAALIILLNVKLIAETFTDWMSHVNSTWFNAFIYVLSAAIATLLVYIIIYPILNKRKETRVNIHEAIQEELITEAIQPFHKIALALDYSDKDRKVIQYAMKVAQKDTLFVLIHIVESVPARMMGGDAHDYETMQDKEMLQTYVQILNKQGYNARGLLGFKNRSKEINRIVRQEQCDILIMGSHGHSGFKDWLFGETINTVRHLLDIPVFIAQ